MSFHFNSELAELCLNKTGTAVEQASLTNGQNIQADIFVSALPAHVIHNLLGEHCSNLNYDYVFSHGFQFHFFHARAAKKQNGRDSDRFTLGTKLQHYTQTESLLANVFAYRLPQLTSVVPKGASINVR